MERIKLYIADDHKLILAGIESMLEPYEHIEVVHTFGDGQALLDQFEVLVPDLVLIDLNMPKKNGVDVTKHIKKYHPNVKILILSMVSNSQVIRRMIKHGADGYLLKNDIQDELIDAIQAVMEDKSYFNADIKKLLFQSPAKKSLRERGRIPHLTPRELEIGQMLVDEMSTPEIAVQLHLSKETVISHRKKLLQKLEVKNTAGIVRKLIDFGLVET